MNFLHELSASEQCEAAARLEKCPVCGLGWVGNPEHVVLMHALAVLMKGVEPERKDYMRYRYRCANGHKWESSRLDK